MVPEVVCRGLQTLKLEAAGVTVLDSMNYLPMSLAAVGKAFNLTEVQKGYFCHKFNTAENCNYKGHRPDAFFYDPANMKPEQRTKFYDWYNRHRNDEFDFQQELRTYCESDVKLLMDGCLKFR